MRHIDYYIRTADSPIDFLLHLPELPQILYSFLASTNDTSKPIILHTPLENCQRNLWPATVSCAATEHLALIVYGFRWNNKFRHL